MATLLSEAPLLTITAMTLGDTAPGHLDINADRFTIPEATVVLQEHELSGSGHQFQVRLSSMRHN